MENLILVAISFTGYYENGGKLTFYMGDKPNYDFGTAKEDRPVSLIFDKE